MKVSSIIAAVGGATTMAVLAGNAVAADFGAPQPLPPPPTPIVYAPVNYHCMRWTEICDRRWGLGAPRFYRCMWRHGC
jgi:hypothetical protein